MQTVRTQIRTDRVRTDWMAVLTRSKLVDTLRWFGQVKHSSLVLFLLFDSLRPINNLSVIKGWVFLGWTSTKLGLMCLAQGHKAVTPVRLEPAASRAKHSTTEPLRWCDVVRTACDKKIDGRYGAGRPKLTWKKLTQKDCREWKLTTDDPQKRSTWRSTLRSGVKSAMHVASSLPGRGLTDVDDANAPDDMTLERVYERIFWKS